VVQVVHMITCCWLGFYFDFVLAVQNMVYCGIFLQESDKMAKPVLLALCSFLVSMIILLDLFS
jgi:hypothetical protein